MKFISWNVNGLRACMQKGFPAFFDSMNADFFCLQETKLQEGQIQLELPGYQQYWCYAEKKGYSGTAIFTKHTPQSVRYGMGIPELDTEGRLITLEYPEFFLVTCYTPNAQRELARIDHRLQWEEAFRNYLQTLDKQKPVILCGDLNVAHKEIDLKNPASNRGSAGFSDQEREAFSKLLDSGFVDSFRYLNPEATGAYTWWSYMYNARKNNAGWRIDYFVVSDRLKEAIYRTPIHSDVMGSDHCPVELDLDITCNGSIWYSEPEGTASEIKPEKEPLSGAATTSLKAGAAAAVLALGLAAGSAVFSHLPSAEQTPETTKPVCVPPEPAFTSYTIYECDFLKIYGYLNAPEPIVDVASSTPSYPFSGFTEGDQTYLFSSATPENLRDITPNCFLRLELTELGKQYISDLSLIDVTVDGVPLGDEQTGVALGFQCYGAVDGWFLYGRITRSRQIEITVAIDGIHKASCYLFPTQTAQAMNYYTPEELADYVLYDHSIWNTDSIFNAEFLMKNKAMKLLMDQDSGIDLLVFYATNGNEVEKQRALQILDQLYQDHLNFQQQVYYDYLIDRYIYSIQQYTTIPTENSMMPPGSTDPNDISYFLYFDGENGYDVAPPEEGKASVTSADYIIRVALSAYGKEQLDEHWHLELMGAYQDFGGPVIREYYDYSQGKRIAGWFIYGRSEKNFHLKIQLVKDSEAITSQIISVTLMQ